MCLCSRHYRPNLVFLSLSLSLSLFVSVNRADLLCLCLSFLPAKQVFKKTADPLSLSLCTLHSLSLYLYRLPPPLSLFLSVKENEHKLQILDDNVISNKVERLDLRGFEVIFRARLLCQSLGKMQKMEKMGKMQPLQKIAHFRHYCLL